MQTLLTFKFLLISIFLFSANSDNSSDEPVKSPSEQFIEEAEHQKRLLVLSALFIATVLLLFLFWQKRANSRLKKMAMTDTLTHIGNRRSIQTWHNLNKPPSLPQVRYMCLIDLDNFKTVNDEYDHDVGDTALMEIAKSLMKFTGKNRSLCRWGGEEFMLLTDDFSQLILEAVSNAEIKSGSVKINLTHQFGSVK